MINRFLKRPNTALTATKSPPSKVTPYVGDANLLVFNVDNSYSMFQNGGIKRLVSAMFEIIKRLERMKRLHATTEVAIFGYSKAGTLEVFTDFTKLSDFTVPKVDQSLSTHIYEAHENAITRTAERIEAIRKDRASGYTGVATSMIVSLSDFCPLANDYAKFRERAVNAVETATECNINCFELLCGDVVQDEVAMELSQAGRPPVTLTNAELESDFANWLVSAFRTASMSQGATQSIGRFGGVELWIN